MDRYDYLDPEWNYRLTPSGNPQILQDLTQRGFAESLPHSNPSELQTQRMASSDLLGTSTGKVTTRQNKWLSNNPTQHAMPNPLDSPSSTEHTLPFMISESMKHTNRSNVDLREDSSGGQTQSALTHSGPSSTHRALGKFISPQTRFDCAVCHKIPDSSRKHVWKYPGCLQTHISKYHLWSFWRQDLGQYVCWLCACDWFSGCNARFRTGSELSNHIVADHSDPSQPHYHYHHSCDALPTISAIHEATEPWLL